MQNFSELQCLVDNLVDFLELSMLNLNILFDEVGRGPGQNKNILLDTIYITFFFFKKKKKLLQMRIVENKYCIEKDDCEKKMTGRHSKRVGFYCEQKK